MFEVRELKLLRLALCPGAARGEVESAAIKFVDSLRARGARAETFSQSTLPELNPGDVVLPFGKYEGRRISEVPENYLAWFAENVATHPRLVRIIRKFLAAEDVPNGW